MQISKEVANDLALLVGVGADARDCVATLTAWHDVAPEALLDAVEAAIAQRAAVTPAQTDLDRLVRAFDRLEADGIVTAQGVGATLHDARMAAWERSFDLELAAGAPSRGLCVYSTQDAASAYAGEGLYLGFGTTEELSPEAERAADEAVGADVVAAMQAEGLTPQWNGSSDTRILVRIEWQHRGVGPFVPTPLDPDALHADVRTEVRVGAYCPTREDLLERWTERQLRRPEGPAHAEFVAFVDALLREAEAEEALWDGPTQTDRLTAAFAVLEASGIATLAGIPSTLADGWGMLGAGGRPDARGGVFFHQQDVLDALDGGGLWLAFGGLQGDHVDPRASAAVGAEAFDVLTAHGFTVTWDGSAAHRLRLAPAPWQPRRWTAPAPVSPKRSVWSRLGFGRPRPIADDAPLLRRQAVLPTAITWVRAHRTSTGVDGALARRVRAADPGSQVGDLGMPLTFVPTGGLLQRVAVPAANNLPSARATALLQRGRRSHVSPES